MEIRGNAQYLTTSTAPVGVPSEMWQRVKKKKNLCSEINLFSMCGGNPCCQIMIALDSETKICKKSDN